jgi:hypothetical protein
MTRAASRLRLQFIGMRMPSINEPDCPITWSMLRINECHLLVHCTLIQSRPVRQLQSNPCHRAVVQLPAASRLRLLSMKPYVQLPGRYCASGHHTICSCTVCSFDPELARRLRPNPYDGAFVPHASACRLRFLSTHPNA